MNTPSECTPLVHDRPIRRVQQYLDSASVVFELDEDMQLVFTNVFCYRAESYLYPACTISADAVYIVNVTWKRNDRLVQEVVSSSKPDGTHKWSNSEAKHARPASDEILHVNLYCIDWEFDVVCTAFCLTRCGNTIWHCD